MGINYFKRFRMEIDLRSPLPHAALPEGYFWVPWEDSLLDLHAEVHYRAFCDEIDSAVFPCFSDRYGCHHLLREISNKINFVPQATWLVACEEGCCGTVQATTDSKRHGAIQNIGVVPEHRGRGLGHALLLQALRGFQTLHFPRAYLEVTAENAGAIRLYYRLGFRRMKTVYKAVCS
jgi:hypothetical protein